MKPQLYLQIAAVTILTSACGSAVTKQEQERKPAPEEQSENTSSTCPSWKQGDTIKVTKNISIPASCSYKKVSFDIVKENITFDCNGATLNGLSQNSPNSVFSAYSKSTEPRRWAFSVRKSGLKIKNCVVKNYVDGIVIWSEISRDNRYSLRDRKNVTAIENELRASSPKNVQVLNTKILNSHKHGIYLQRYITNMSFINGEIQNSGNSAIYLESGTQNHTIKNSYFYKNGYTNYKLAKRMRMPKLPTGEREAIAVDSSANNKIIGNTFKNNGKGGIFLYKNCYEKHSSVGQMPRVQHSNNNRIEGNSFINERYGVWVASRQSKELSGFKCGDPLMHKSSGLFGTQKYYQDYAKNNTVVNNSFKDVVYGIVIEDDNNKVTGNSFSGRSSVDIKVGTPYRAKALNRPVKGTTVSANKRQDGSIKVDFVYGAK